MYESEISKCRGNIKAYSDQIEALTEEISDLETYAERYSGKVGEVDGLKNGLLDQVRKICDIDAGLAIQEKIRTTMTAAISGHAFASFSQSVSSCGTDISKEIKSREEEIESLNTKITTEKNLLTQYETMAGEAGEDLQNG